MTADTGDVRRVLFVGNSQFYYYKIPDMVEAMSQTAAPMRCVGALKGGAWLATHLAHAESMAMLVSEAWDVVVLQDHYCAPDGAENREKSRTGTREIVARVRALGAQPILYATPNIEANGRAGFQAIHDLNAELAAELDVPLAAGGAACLAVWDQLPDLDLHDTDRMHPNAVASYVGACAIYTAITGLSPVGLTSGPFEKGTIAPDVAATIQQSVWTLYGA